jgi:hypothetical protein
VLGETRDLPDRPRTANALRLGVSPHLELEETPWRLSFMRSLAANAPRFEEPLPWSGRSGDGAEARLGSHCGLATHGLVCADVSGDERRSRRGPDGVRTLDAAPRVGTCVAEGRGRVGDPAERSVLTPRWRDAAMTSPSLDGDLVAHPQGSELACAGGALPLPNKNGFPGGMCTASCKAENEGAATTESGRDVVCARVPELRFEEFCYFSFGAPGTRLADAALQTMPIDACLTSTLGGRKQSDFWQLQACDAARPCRDDYVCAQVPGAKDGGAAGGCVPPYFVMQLRVDGPPSDRPGNATTAEPGGPPPGPAACVPNDPAPRASEWDPSISRDACLADPVLCLEDVTNPITGSDFICWKNGMLTSRCNKRCANGSFVNP